MILNIFSQTYLPSAHSFWWSICSSLLLIFNWIVHVFNAEYWEFFINSGWNSLSDIWFASISLDIAYSFHSLNNAFLTTKLTFYPNKFIIMPFVSYPRTSCLITVDKSFLLFSSTGFIIFCFIFRFIFHY